MLIVMMMLIIIDRALYLRKAVVCKLIYQLATIIFLHIWIFFILPQITKIKVVDNRVAMFFYLIKSVYFFVSAWQIRNSYPPLCIGNFLTRSFSLMNMIAFKMFVHFCLFFLT